MGRACIDDATLGHVVTPSRTAYTLMGSTYTEVTLTVNQISEIPQGNFL